ncbi:MAG: hypothetical protein SR1Q7_00645 [Quinella sp. 1Q7]|nr:hypothetical protein [Quinella sp. 1Q7]
MFEDGAKLDDILNKLRRPTLDNEDDSKNERITDAAIRYESNRAPVNTTVTFDFGGQRTTEVLK